MTNIEENRLRINTDTIKESNPNLIREIAVSLLQEISLLKKENKRLQSEILHTELKYEECLNKYIESQKRLQELSVSTPEVIKALEWCTNNHVTINFSPIVGKQ